MQLLQHARTLFLVEIDEDGVGVGLLDFERVGGEIRLAGLGGIFERGLDAVFIYLNEEESARKLKELHKAGITSPLVGETTLIGQKVIELAGADANGAVAHVGLSVDAPVPALKAFGEKFKAKYNYVPDHNGMKGYMAIYMIKAATEKMGKLDPKGLPAALHGLKISAQKEPGILMDVTIDENGDLDRQSFLGKVVDGKQVITDVLPPLGK